ncbi:3-hydroxyacyl-CoA dehydrogenase NAD-binding domain-containing protein [Prosthecobacter vanneervenii]|uniref:enoyl-CoA hydratase n=1 Tax=Prosthecobacter vanneervenii TaxID=48466 RepID=A0A7W7Y9T2_9BACT|nr:3-hydroxyacyl-CoA dehydrogenase NAD-binding domain-containing protein [Prosthecobacter vanneervenii]MBB5032261.1 3-hydroxyacyl-CoA dehydrogenase/enoyl-CoA hydratase/3-hydroxybutyryl-CoA epimerase [Prosthecobacter vanneervenii]
MKTLLLNRPAVIHDPPHVLEDIIHGHPVTPKHFRLEVDHDGIAWITFDSPKSSANVWNEETLREFNHVLENIEHDTRAKALVLRSAKERIFIAGADIKAIRSLPHARVNDLIWLGQAVFDRLARLKIPKVAAIHGACMGGGFEVTLCCDWRIASDHDSTKIGLPETQLGILPAWGGSTRLSRLVGLRKALDLITTGKLLNAGAAKKAGLVSHVVPMERMEVLARRLVRGKRPASRFHFENFLAPVIGRMARRKVLQKTRGLYPSVTKAVEVVCHAVRGEIENGLLLERNAVDELLRSPDAARLIDLFFKREEAGKRPVSDGTVLPILDATVIGAGVMGSGIAHTLASRGVRVLMTDVSNDSLARGLERIHGLVSDATRRRLVTQVQGRDTLDRISATHVKVPLCRHHLIIEAATENMELKKKIFADLAMRVPVDTILATNTSALSIAELARSVPHPERVIGLHFFNPVHRMPLVEIITLPETSADVLATAVSFVQKIGKTPVVVKDSPGFLVNRILVPYLMEAVRLHQNGVPVKDIDDAMLEFGMPMGPMRLLDEIGLDVAAHVARTLATAFPDRFPNSDALDKMVSAGHLGRKSGEGFYKYENGKEITPARHADLPKHESIQTKLALLISQEAMRCLKEGIARSADDIDLAMVLGTGYPPFRGGPVTFARDTGIIDY